MWDVERFWICWITPDHFPFSYGEFRLELLLMLMGKRWKFWSRYAPKCHWCKCSPNLRVVWRCFCQLRNVCASYRWIKLFCTSLDNTVFMGTSSISFYWLYEPWLYRWPHCNFCYYKSMVSNGVLSCNYGVTVHTGQKPKSFRYL